MKKNSCAECLVVFTPSLPMSANWSSSVVSYVSTTPRTFGSVTVNDSDVATGTFLANHF
jgi:hypothetical protein